MRRNIIISFVVFAFTVSASAQTREKVGPAHPGSASVAQATQRTELKNASKVDAIKFVVALEGSTVVFDVTPEGTSNADITDLPTSQAITKILGPEYGWWFNVADKTYHIVPAKPQTGTKPSSYVLSEEEFMARERADYLATKARIKAFNNRPLPQPPPSPPPQPVVPTPAPQASTPSQATPSPVQEPRPLTTAEFMAKERADYLGTRADIQAYNRSGYFGGGRFGTFGGSLDGAYLDWGGFPIFEFQIRDLERRTTEKWRLALAFIRGAQGANEDFLLKGKVLVRTPRGWRVLVNAAEHNSRLSDVEFLVELDDQGDAELVFVYESPTQCVDGSICFVGVREFRHFPSIAQKEIVRKGKEAEKIVITPDLFSNAMQLVKKDQEIYQLMPDGKLVPLEQPKP